MKLSVSNFEQIAQKAKRSLPHLEYDDILQEAHLLDLTTKSKVTVRRLVKRLSDKVQCEVDSDRVTKFIDSRYSYPDAENLIHFLQVYTLVFESGGWLRDRHAVILYYLYDKPIEYVGYHWDISTSRAQQIIRKRLRRLKRDWDSIQIPVKSDGTLDYANEEDKEDKTEKAKVESVAFPRIRELQIQTEYERSLSIPFTLIAAGIEENTVDALLSWIKLPANWQYLVAQKSITINDRVIPWQQYTVTINLDLATIVIVQLHSGLVNNGNRTCSTSNG